MSEAEENSKSNSVCWEIKILRAGDENLYVELGTEDQYYPEARISKSGFESALVDSDIDMEDITGKVFKIHICDKVVSIELCHDENFKNRTKEKGDLFEKRLAKLIERIDTSEEVFKARDINPSTDDVVIITPSKSSVEESKLLATLLMRKSRTDKKLISGEPKKGGSKKFQ